MNCRCGFTLTRVLSRRRCRALPLSCLLAVIAGLFGCVANIGNTAETVEVDLVIGETTSGSLVEGQRLRAFVPVEADYIYEVSISLFESFTSSTGLSRTEGLISGAPLAGPISFTVDSPSGSSLGDSKPSTTFIAYADGEVTIEFTYTPTDADDTVGGLLGTVRGLLFGTEYAYYDLLINEVGFDDNGTSPEDAVALVVGPAGELTGTISTGDDADYFLLDVQADTTYQLHLETTDSVDVTSGSEDRFGRINYGVPTASGLTIVGSASAGIPGTVEFTASADEQVLLRLTGSVSSPSSTDTIQYAISVIAVAPEVEGG